MRILGASMYMPTFIIRILLAVVWVCNGTSLCISLKNDTFAWIYDIAMSSVAKWMLDSHLLKCSCQLSCSHCDAASSFLFCGSYSHSELEDVLEGCPMPLTL